MIKHLFCLSLLSSVLVAGDYPARHSSALGLSGSSAGIGLNFVYTGRSRLGFELGFNSAGRRDEDLPTEGYFSWVNYNQTDWKSKSFYHAGLAFRINANVTICAGVSQYEKETYRYGYSTVTGWNWRIPGETEKKKGPFFLVDFGAQSGVGGQIFAGSGVVGAAITFRMGS